MIYDSAIPYPESTFSQLHSVSSRRPFQRVYLTAIDTPDMRIFCSSESINWNTKIGELVPDVKHRLLMQKCRRPSVEHVEYWNKYVAKDFACWAENHHQESYCFSFRTTCEGELEKIYNDSSLIVSPQPTNENNDITEDTATTPATTATNMDTDLSGQEKEVANTAIIETKKRPLVNNDINIPNKKQKVMMHIMCVV